MASEEEREITMVLDPKTCAKVTEMALRDGKSFEESLSVLLGALAEYAIVYDLMFCTSDSPGPDDTLH